MVVIMLRACAEDFVRLGHDFDNERDASGAATNFILDHTQAGDGIIFHIADTRVPYEFFRVVARRAEYASSVIHGQFGPEILFPRHGSSLDYRDFTGKPSAELLRTAAPATHPGLGYVDEQRSAGNPDPTTVMLSRFYRESYAKVRRAGNLRRWKFCFTAGSKSRLGQKLEPSEAITKSFRRPRELLLGLLLPKSRKASRLTREANRNRSDLFRLIQVIPAALALRRLGLGLLHPQGLVDPVVGGLQVFGASGQIVALHIGAVRGTSGSCTPWRRRSPDEAESPCSDCRCLPESPGCSSPSARHRASSGLCSWR